MKSTPFYVHDFNTCKPIRRATMREVELVATDPRKRWFGDGTFIPLYQGQEVEYLRAWLERHALIK